MSGIVNVLKPAGYTSNKVVSIIKHKLKAKKVGHLGTLDPSVAGVLPVCIDKATRLFDHYLQKNKTYRAIFIFGKTTDTLDSDGQITGISDKIPSTEEIIEGTKKLTGIQQQIPPHYSAKNINGQRAYTLARQNIEFTLKPKEVEIYRFELLSKISENAFLFEIACSAGTYIRSLIRDLAEHCGTVGYMGALIRTESGNFTIADAVEMDEITEKDIIKAETLLKDLETFDLHSDFYSRLINGIRVEVDSPDKQNIALYCNNQLIGIADIKDKQIIIKTNLRET